MMHLEKELKWDIEKIKSQHAWDKQEAVTRPGSCRSNLLVAIYALQSSGPAVGLLASHCW